jgi:hypothetical protein
MPLDCHELTNRYSADHPRQLTIDLPEHVSNAEVEGQGLIRPGIAWHEPYRLASAFTPYTASCGNASDPK